MDHQPLVTIIIPVFNSEKYVEACLQSALCQSYKHLEIIVVDDGSTDHSPSIIDRLAARDKRIIPLHKPHEGLVLARKAGIEKATGTYIQHLDADDSLFSNAIEQLVCRAEQTQADIVATQFLFCHTDREGELSEKLLFDQTDGVNYYDQILRGHGYWSVWSNFHRRTLYQRADVRTVPEISYGEDAVLMTQLILSAGKVAALHQPVLNYNRYDTSMTGSMNKAKYRELRAAERWIRDYLAEKGLTQRFDYGLACWQVRQAFYSVYWRRFEHTTQDMTQIGINLRRYPQLQETLSLREQKIVASYSISPLWGYAKILSYRIRGKI